MTVHHRDHGSSSLTPAPALAVSLSCRRARGGACWPAKDALTMATSSADMRLDE
ncbi:MAG: hypothetical protein ACRDL7_04070 [Gaiellaceae bacterium]